MRKKIFLGLLLPAIWLIGRGQHLSDTTAAIREFNEVMSFAVQPYVHYTSTMSFQTGPMTDGSDTGNVLHVSFYKSGDDLYYGNEQEETYLQDSLMVQINHHRKTIQLSKVDLASKQKVDVLPLKKMDRQKLLRQHYTISRLPDHGDTGYIVIRSHDGVTAARGGGTEMLLLYRLQSHLPMLMQVTMKVRQQGSDQMADALRSKGYDVSKMVGVKDGLRSLIMSQTAAVRFGPVEMTKESAALMPSWNKKIAYDPVAMTYSGKGECAGYEVIKTF